MPAVTLTPEDLAPFAEIPDDKAEAMIDDALAMATLVAPCIATDAFAYADAARAVIRGAVLRWHEAGSGASAQLVALGFSQTLDTRQQRRGMFWPSEIEQLQRMCSETTARAIFSVDTFAPTSRHVRTCALHHGGQRCSCGVTLLA